MIAGLLLWLLVGPRVELPGIPSMRVEDLVLGVLALICLAHLRAFGRRPGGVTVAVVAVVMTGAIAGLIAGARGTLDPVTALLYAVRPMEYWIAFPAALLLLRGGEGVWRRRVDAMLAITTVLQTGFAVLQYYFQIPIGFSHAAYTRAAGLTVGPYELGAISAALAVYWVSRGRWVLASLSVIALAASISRVSLLGAGIALGVLTASWLVRQVHRIGRDGFAASFRPYVRFRLHAVGQVLAVATAGLVLAFTLGLITPPDLSSPAPVAGPAAPVTETGPGVDDGATTPAGDAASAPGPTPTTSSDDSAVTAPELPSAPAESITTRLADTSVLGSWQLGGALAAGVPHLSTAAEYQDIAYSHINDFINAGNAANAGAEPSNLVRFFRWNLILDTIDDPVDVVFGLGPSFVGPSVDGSYLRFFADAGLLGLLAWLALIVMWLRRSPVWMTCVTISLLVGALFIDIVYAERPMVLYWLLLAVAVSGRAARRSEPTEEATAAPVEAKPVVPAAVRSAAEQPAPVVVPV